MIRYKVDVIKEMSKYGYNQYKIQKEKLLPGQTIANIRAGGRYIAIRSPASDLPLTAYQNNATMP